MSKATAFVVRLVTSLHWVSAVLIFVVMCLIVADILLRRLLAVTIPGNYELNQLFLLVMVYCGLAHTQSKRAHISAELIVSMLSPRAAALVRSISLVTGIVLLAWLFWTGWGVTYEAWRHGLFTGGAKEWPYWPFYLSVPVGSFLYCVIALGQLTQEIRALARRASKVEVSRES